MTTQNYIPGMRVEIRDAEWRIDQVDVPTHGGMLLSCTGHSELVRGKTGKFLTDLENDTRILSPETTELADDLSPGYQATQLYVHTVLQSTPPADNKIHLGHQAAMDLLPYQLDPALQALKQTRPRILIADAVGLGKTIGAGVLATELIRRGRGKRILVLAVKSMLAQFQREMWQRFTIPLVRLDSVGLQRMRNNIPANHNPFHYFDRAIISIDTLKQNLEYRDYLENCHWDMVIIDEAHNVAKRSNNSLRHQLASLLCTQCDAMVMLSATPHDGKPESFASLIHMLDPTAIPDIQNYEHDDYKDKGLVIRRFKKDVASQLATRLPEREVHQCKVAASTAEDEAFSIVRQAEFRTLNKVGGAGQLFRTTIEKTLLSSSLACLSTTRNRLTRLEKRLTEQNQRDTVSDETIKDIEWDIEQLEAIELACRAIGPEDFAKYQLLLNMLKDKTDESIGWDRKDSLDRIVLFTESILTLDFLKEQLPKDLKLKTGTKTIEFAELHGSMKDIDIADTVNEFNRPQSSLRLLLCSDVASEGLNLHHCAHRLIHFDIPWSLMVFQQRNGRIDRYGQTIKPEIYYLASQASDEKVKGDQRVLDILIEKDTQASLNLGDPSEFMGGASVEEQEAITAELIERDDGAQSTSDFLDQLLSKSASSIEAFDNNDEPTSHEDLTDVIASPNQVYKDTGSFAQAALGWLETERRDLSWSFDTKKNVLDVTAPADLQQITKRLPREAIPKDYRFLLTDEPDVIMHDMQEARDDETGTFGQLQYLWPHHPLVGWLMQCVQDSFGRHTAPVMRMPKQLAEDEHWFIAQGGFPNKRGQALIQDHVAVLFKGDSVADVLPMAQLLEKLKIDGSKVTNRGEPRDCEPLKLYLEDVVTHLRSYLLAKRDEQLEKMTGKVGGEIAALEALRNKHVDQLELELKGSKENDSRKQRRRLENMNRIDNHFKHYEQWLRDTTETEEEPYIQIIAVITGSEGELIQ